MAYIVHGARGSGSGIVEAACAELGVDYTIVDLDVRANEHRGDAYGKLNPQHKMPTLELGDGEVMTESVAILLTLDERHPDAGLLPPPGSRARAQALRWMLFMATEMYPLMELIDAPERFMAPPPDAKSLHARAVALWLERWRVIEDNISGSPYCVETGFCATDLYITVLSRWDMTEAWRRENLPKVEALTTEVRARPALASVWARHKV